jgi:hypothetical protein
MADVRRVLAAAVALAFAASAGAAEKVKCLEADDLPIIISAPGSYRLCKTLKVPDANTTAIVVTASNVSIDLDGFSIIGPNECSRWSGCTAQGTGHGIKADSATNVTVTNGTVRGVGNTGIHLGLDSRVEKVKAISNGYRGISVGTGSIVANCIAISNGEWGGITAAEYSTIRENVVHGNLGTGINGGCVSTVIGNSSTSNGGNGISTGGTSGCATNLVCENQSGQLDGCTQMGPNTCCYGLCP